MPGALIFCMPSKSASPIGLTVVITLAISALIAANAEFTAKRNEPEPIRAQAERLFRRMSREHFLFEELGRLARETPAGSPLNWAMRVMREEWLDPATYDSSANRQVCLYLLNFCLLVENAVRNLVALFREHPNPSQQIVSNIYRHVVDIVRLHLPLT